MLHATTTVNLTIYSLHFLDKQVCINTVRTLQITLGHGALALIT